MPAVMLDFKPFKIAVAKSFNELTRTGLWRTDVPKEILWETYQDSFPEGTNPLHKNRREHECNSCKNFISRVGSLVTIRDGKTVSLWEAAAADESVDPAYRQVASQLAKLVGCGKITGRFFTAETTAGAQDNFDAASGAAARKWSHFFVNLPAETRSSKVGEDENHVRGGREALKNALDLYTVEACEQVLDFISQGSILRSESYRHTVEEFLTLLKTYQGLPPQARELQVWVWASELSDPVIRIRGSAVGDLLLGKLSAGEDVNKAVEAFNYHVDPVNYKRATAPVSQTQINKAREAIEELGLLSALSRRMMTSADVPTSEVVYVERAAARPADDSVFSGLSPTKIEKTPDFSKIESISLEKFIDDVLPRTSTLELLFEKKHVPRLAGLVTAEDPTARGLMAWGNHHSWSYRGGLAGVSQIKERVKAAGGATAGALRFSLAWGNHDDYDLHMYEPSGFHVCYNATYSPRTGAQLDLDANSPGSGLTRTPVENIIFPDRKRMTKGVYKIVVRNYAHREAANPGFELEVEFEGKVYTFRYPKGLRTKEEVAVASFEYDGSDLVLLPGHIDCSEAKETVWGLETGSFARVQMIVPSPNHWEGEKSGEKHLFFVLEGCRPDEAVRGFYNEFLRSDLSEHRKAMELVGSRVSASPSPGELAGLGFQPSVPAELVVRTTGATRRTLRVVV